MHKINRLKLVVCVERTLITFVKKTSGCEPPVGSAPAEWGTGCNESAPAILPTKYFQNVFSIYGGIDLGQSLPWPSISQPQWEQQTPPRCAQSAPPTPPSPAGAAPSSPLLQLNTSHLPPHRCCTLNKNGIFPIFWHKIFFIDSLGNAKAINLCKAWIALRSSSPLITIHQQQAAVYRPVGRQAAWK